MKATLQKFAASLFLIGSQLLTACLPATNVDDEPSAWSRSHRLGNGDIIATGPTNYCVDRTTRATGDFVLMVNCDVLSDQARTAPSARGILTVSTSARLGHTSQDIDLASSLGIGSVHSTRVPGLVVRHMTKQSSPRLPGAAADHWRGLLELNNRIVSFAAYGPEGGSVSRSSGKRLLENLAKATIASSQVNPG